MPEGTVNRTLEYICLCVTGAEVEVTLKILTSVGVKLHQVRRLDALTASFVIQKQDYSKTKTICEKRGDGLRILRRGGVGHRLNALLRRPILFFGLMLVLAATLCIPSRVLFIQVEGNESVPDRLILEAAEQCGICFGASRRDVRSEKIKNALLEQVPQLQWAGVNTRGCVAMISVRERIPEETTPVPSDFGHVVAVREGIITSCTAYSGTLLCTPGSAVAEGEILISGYTDCGLCIRAEQAQGEIYANTVRQIRAVIPDSLLEQSNTGKVKRKISLIVGKKRIFLWKYSGIWDSTCDRMYEEYYVTLPGGFQLPLALGVETFYPGTVSQRKITGEEAQTLLDKSCDSYLTVQMIGGSILDEQLHYTTEEGCMRLAAQYICNEMIGKMQRQQIGENNGKNN